MTKKDKTPSRQRKAARKAPATSGSRTLPGQSDTLESPRCRKPVRDYSARNAHTSALKPSRRDWARRHLEEAGESARNLRRPGLARLFTVLNDCAIGAVILPGFARLARNPDDLARLLERLGRRGIILFNSDGCL